jgi:exopolysaccharide biosynthesis protein
MEKIKILGVDPSLRNTGLAIVTYNTELSFNDPSAFEVSHCQVLVNPKKYTGTDAILNMLDMMHQESLKTCYQEAETVIVESPAIMFNKKISSSVVAALGHISGGAVALFGIEKSHLFRPNEWNKTRKKEITHSQTIAYLGNADKWHYENRVRTESFMEHILDAASMALFWIKSNYLEE